jgi:hypothetical protein
LFAVILNGCVFFENSSVANSGSIENPETDDSIENIIYFRGDMAIRSGGEYTYDTVIALNRSDNTFVLDFNMMSRCTVAKGTFTESEHNFIVSLEDGRAQFSLEKMPDGSCIVQGDELHYYYVEDGGAMLKITAEQYNETVKCHAEWNAQNIESFDLDYLVPKAFKFAVEFCKALNYGDETKLKMYMADELFAAFKDCQTENPAADMQEKAGDILSYMGNFRYYEDEMFRIDEHYNVSRADSHIGGFIELVFNLHKNGPQNDGSRLREQVAATIILDDDAGFLVHDFKIMLSHDELRKRQIEAFDFAVEFCRAFDGYKEL